MDSPTEDLLILVDAFLSTGFSNLLYKSAIALERSFFKVPLALSRFSKSLVSFKVDHLLTSVKAEPLANLLIPFKVTPSLLIVAGI